MQTISTILYRVSTNLFGSTRWHKVTNKIQKLFLIKTKKISCHFDTFIEIFRHLKRRKISNIFLQNLYVAKSILLSDMKHFPYNFHLILLFDLEDWNLGVKSCSTYSKWNYWKKEGVLRLKNYTWWHCHFFGLIGIDRKFR